MLDLIAEELGTDYEWQKTFDTLLGDPGKNGKRRKLPVDAYFHSLKIVVEYREKQHTETVNIMDKRMTISGVTRGEQRKIYDKRKEVWTVENRMTFVPVSYIDLSHRVSGKLLRDCDIDRLRIRSIFRKYL